MKSIVKLNGRATALVDAAARRRADDPLLRKVLWQEWATCFPTRTVTPS